MIRFRRELEEVRYGFNVYRFDDPNNVGFVLKFWHNKSISIRYSKNSKKMLFVYRNIGGMTRVISI